MRRLLLFVALGALSVAATAGAVSTAFSTASFTTDSTTSVQASTPGGDGNVMTPYDGDDQTADAGTAVDTPPSVQLTDANGIPLSGATVVFAVASGGGRVTGATALTDGSGIASVGSWTLGGLAGDNSLTATAAGVAGGVVTFIATGVAGQAASTTVTASNTRPVAGSQVTLTARYADRFGNPVVVAGILTTFTLNGSGLLKGANPTQTDASGAATITLLTSTVAGASATVSAMGAGASGTSPSITTAAGPANTIVTVAGAGLQSASVGTAVPTAPSVLVTDANSNPIAGAVVTFSVTAGGGSLTGGSATTNASGIATVGSWTLGPTAGLNTLAASISGVAGQVSFSAMGTTSDATKYVVTSSAYQPAAGSSVTITAQLTDAYGNAVATPGLAVTFTKTGAGSFTTANPATTDTGGKATISMTTGTTTGSTVTVTATSTTPTTRTGTSPTITTISGTPSKITASAGTGQSATVGTAVTTAPRVLVTDANNNPVSGLDVTFSVTGGGGSVTGAVATTNSSGMATVGSWTLGTSAGANTLSATAVGIGSSSTFTATGLAGAATKYLVAASATSPVAGAGVTVSAQLADQYGNAVATAGLSVAWTKTGTSGSLSTTTSTTSSSGIAAVTLTTSTTAGVSYTVTATSTSPSTRTGTSPAITSVAGTAAKIAASAGNGQSATVGTAVTIPPGVLVTDANNNPISGFSVSFSVYSGGGSVTGASATTDASGIATVGSWTLGTTAGSNSLRATASGLSGSPVTFTATGVAAPAVKYIVTSSNYAPTAGTAVTITAQLVDQNGAPVKTSGIRVTWSKTGSGGSFSSSRSTTDSNGIATVTFTTSSTKNRTYTIKATDSSSRTGTSPTITTK
jgi:hypothetical protein